MNSAPDRPPIAAEATAPYLATPAAAQPAPGEQVDFLEKVQRIFQEGEFSATYKFALLIALTELAVERGTDDLSPLVVRVRWIAEKFAELYWPQTFVYSSPAKGGQAGVLSQNLGRMAAVVRALVKLREHTGASSIGAARRTDAWDAAMGDIARTVRSQPLNYLQNVAGQRVEFLYRRGASSTSIELLPGVAFNLRRFGGMIEQLARAHWVRHVRENRQNAPILGETGDLESFMFGLARANLEPARVFLERLQSGRCFYCRHRLGGHGEVDHFIPWSKYPRDLAHNFVVAHAACNRSKSDMLASRAHLEQWHARNSDRCDIIAGELSARGFLADGECTRVVARWAYRQASNSGARAWTSPANFEPIDAEWLSVLD